MSPSEKYIQECINNADRLREEWEPFHYDVLYILGDVKLIMPHEGEDERVAYVYTRPFDRDPMGVMRGIGLEWHPRKNIVWLPRLDQLIEMLEERGCKSLSLHRSYIDQIAFGSEPEWAVRFQGDPYPQTFFGPDPATALLRCLLEVMKNE